VKKVPVKNVTKEPSGAVEKQLAKINATKQFEEYKANSPVLEKME